MRSVLFELIQTLSLPFQTAARLRQNSDFLKTLKTDRLLVFLFFIQTHAKVLACPFIFPELHLCFEGCNTFLRPEKIYRREQEGKKNTRILSF